MIFLEILPSVYMAGFPEPVTNAPCGWHQAIAGPFKTKKPEY